MCPGRPFPNAMRERVFDELGMSRTWAGPFEQDATTAVPHEWQWGRVRVSPSLFFGWLGASLVKSTARNMGRYLTFLLGDADGDAELAMGPNRWLGLEKGYDLGWYVQTEGALAGWGVCA